MYASFGFTGMPVDNGWEYIQILGDNAETCDDKDPDDSVNTPSLLL